MREGHYLIKAIKNPNDQKSLESGDFVRTK